ncbi:MAG: protein translocase subunit SecDF, partial [Bacteroidales bacterium]|nr:protein translocase subunit SecDF [Bacteroidales bacterium]
MTSRVQKNAEKEAKAYVESAEVRDAVAAKTTDATEQQIMLDSIQQRRETEILNGKAEEKIYLGYTYRQCQAREIGLGLDLKGGMNVILEVSMKDLVKLLADNTEDPLFNEALENAVKAQKTSVNKDFVTLFYEEITALDKNVKLASYFGSNKDLPNIGLNSSNDDIVKAIREQATSAYENTYQVITQRIDRFGVAQPTIQKLAASERILVELPGVKDPERVRTLLQGTAQLEFWAVYENDEVMQNLYDADKILAAIYMNKGTEADSTADSTAVAEENETDRMSNVDAAEHPLLSMLQLNAGGGKSPYIAFAKGADRDSIDRMLARAAEKKAFDTRRVKFLWSRKPENEKENIYVLYAMKVMSRDGVKPLLDGEFISDARQDFTSTGENEVSMTMTREGAIKWKKITGDNVGKCIAIVLDDQVCSAPVVNDEISGGRSSITGHFTLEEAKDLANIL